MSGVLQRLLERALGPRPRFRAEHFGGVVATERPAALSYVDREMARALGQDGGARWQGEAPEGFLGHRLSAPVEVHLMLTNRCPVGCTGCYAGSTPEGSEGELDTAGWIEVIDGLADAGVFHVALGGGESLLRDDLLLLARHARRRGLVPNLTTSGLGLEPQWVEEAAALFGRINVSVDGVKQVYAASRGRDLFDVAVRALRMLRAHSPRVGINCVVSRHSYPRLMELGQLARELDVDEIELLRFKPAGRGREVFESYDLTNEQRLGLLDQARSLRRRFGLRVRLDCSFVPFLAVHGLDPEELARFGVVGCDGGNHLAAIRADGAVTACSFWEQPAGPRGRSLSDLWEQPGSFEPFRSFPERAGEPCRSCDYLQLCRGGCRAVALHSTGDGWSPDPGCPKVLGLLPVAGDRQPRSGPVA